MNRRALPLVAALVMTALAFMVWERYDFARQQREDYKRSWSEYIQGPLGDLLYGSSRLRPLLVKKRLNAAEQAEAKDAVESLRRSARKAQALAEFSKGRPMLAGFQAIADWHTQVRELLEPWKNLVGKPVGKDALSVEAEMRLQLWKLLDKERGQLIKAHLLSEEEVLETNAMLYSLKEGTDSAAKNPLGGR